MMNPKVPPLETADDLCHYPATVMGCYARILFGALAAAGQEYGL